MTYSSIKSIVFPFSIQISDEFQQMALKIFLSHKLFDAILNDFRGSNIFIRKIVYILMRVLGIIPESALAIQITHCQMIFFLETIKIHTYTFLCGESAEERFRQ